MLKTKASSLQLKLLNYILYKELSSNKKEFVMSRQLLKSGTSIGANIREAKFAQSKLDFISKMSISLKEANETDYWLELLFKTDFIDETIFEEFKIKSTELIKLLASIVKSSKRL